MPVLESSVSVQRQAWWAIQVMHRKLALELMEEELRNETGIDMATYDALMHIVKAGDLGIRMTDLARDVYMSKPGLTGVVDRLEQSSLVRRTPDPDDRRAIRITLTDQGVETAGRAARFHTTCIEKHFADRVTDVEAGVILDIMKRVTPDSDSPRPPA